MSKDKVTDFPLWEDCPFRKLVPDWLEIRKGNWEGAEIFVLWSPKYEVHCDATIPGKLPPLPRELIKTMLNNIGGAIFEKEFPAQYMKLVKAKVEAAAEGRELPERWRSIDERMKELTF